MQAKTESIAPYMRRFSTLSNQICSYLENVEETQFLTVRQRTFIKHYLLVHVLEGEMESAVGIVDYFSSSMLDLVCRPTEDFAIYPS